LDTGAQRQLTNLPSGFVVRDFDRSLDEPNGRFGERGRLRVISFGAGLSPRQIQQHDIRALLLALEDDVAVVERRFLD
jgi:hypothetical protein